MPYIKEDERFPDSCFSECDNVGELNYSFSKIINKYLNEKGLKYQHINDVIGALECCKLELYRRIAVPYEDVKIKENGDVFTKKEES